MKQHIRGILTIAICIFTFSSAYSQPQRVPAYRGVLTYVQPNGDTLHYYLRGDEWSHFSMTLDGYEIRENKKGKMCYMRQKRNGEAVVTLRQAKDENKRSRCEKKWLEKNGILKIVKRENL